MYPVREPTGILQTGVQSMIENDIVDDFGATDQNGQKVRLTKLLESGPLVLFFYPKAMTPG